MAAQFARLRNLDAQLCADPNLIASAAAMERTLIAMSFRRLERLSKEQILLLRARVASGDILYIRGGFSPADTVSLAPFAATRIEIAETRTATSIRYTNHTTIPRTLAGEVNHGQFSIAGIALDREIAEPLVLVHHSDGAERCAIFLMRFDRGVVLCDLSDDHLVDETPIIERLADTAARPRNLGALIAANLASGTCNQRRPAFNLTVDDRPANLDYFSRARVTRFFDRARSFMPEVHVDFAWTPSQCHVSYRYVEVLKQYRAGFVWNGFLKQANRKALNRPRSQLSVGARLVSSLMRRYGVRFQPVMVLPFKNNLPECLEALQEDDFLALVQSAPAGSGRQPEYLTLSRPEFAGKSRTFVILNRQMTDRLTYDSMLAQTILGLPVLAFVQPEDLALKRLPLASRPRYFFPTLDRVVEFAASKRLRPLPLEAIALEIKDQ